VKKENYMDAIEVIGKHKTIRKYKNKKIPDEHFNIIINSGIRAPSSANLQTYSVIRVKDMNIRRILYEIAGNQEHILQASEFLIFIADIRRIIKCLEILNINSSKPNFFMLYISAIDAAIAAENMVIAAETLGYGICYIGAIQNDPCKVCEILKLPIGTYPLFGLTIGIPDESPVKRFRLSKEALIYEDEYPTNDINAKIAVKDYKKYGYIESFIRRFKRYFGIDGRYSVRNKIMIRCLEKQGFKI